MLVLSDAMHRDLLFSLLLQVAFAIGCQSCDKVSGDLVQKCQAAGSNRLQSDGLRVYVASTLEGTRLSAGKIPSCSAKSRATRLYLQAREALVKIPEDLLPDRVAIHFSPKLSASTPPIDVAEVHKSSASILIHGPSVERIDHSTLLHEMAHLKMGTAQSEGVVASRLMESLEEGIADYYAATIQGSPRLGARQGKAARDLGKRPIWLRGGWTKLSEGSEPWSAHDQGWALAALLWEEENQAGELLRDLVSCMKKGRVEASDSPAEVIEAWLDGCPARSQQRILKLLHRWIPSTMY